jgi:hypothetical protein
MLACPEAIKHRLRFITMANQFIVTLMCERKQLRKDLDALERGATGGTLGARERKTLHRRLVTLDLLIAEQEGAKAALPETAQLASYSISN